MTAFGSLAVKRGEKSSPFSVKVLSMTKAYAAKEAGGKLEAFSYDPGQLGHDEVEINLESCGVCHSDLSMLVNEWSFTEYPLVPGHEVLGTIGEVGSNVSAVQTGQRVG